MGRCGARQTAEATKSLDINWLSRNGYLVPACYTLTWRQEEEQVGSIGMRAQQCAIVLDYRWRQFDGEWESVNEQVHLVSTPCNYGGQRPWFMCPGCWRRVGKLFAAGKYFLCRHCYHLPYESQREDGYYRLLRKVQKIRIRLGGSSNLIDPFPPKPKGMHEKTYRRLEREADEAECNLDAGFVELVNRFFRCSDRVSSGVK